LGKLDLGRIGTAARMPRSARPYT